MPPSTVVDPDRPGPTIDHGRPNLRDLDVRSPPATCRPRREHLPVLTAYVVLTVLVLWPAIRHFRSRYLLSTGDSQLFIWSWWAVPHALGRGQNPFQTTDAFFPVGADLALTTTVPLLAVLLWPLRTVLGPAAQVNAVQLGSVLLTALLVYALALRLTPSRAAAGLAGAAFAFAPYRFVHLTHLNLVNVWVLPLGILALLRFGDVPSRKRSLLLGAAMGVSFLVDPQLAMMLVVALAVLGVVRRHALYDAWRRVVTAAAVAFAVAAPLLVPMAFALWGGEADPVIGLGDSWFYSSDLLSWVIPPKTNPVLGGLLPVADPAPTEGLAYPGLLLLGLAILSRKWVDRRRRRPWVALGLVAFVLSLGPFLHLGGRSGALFTYAGHSFSVPLPFMALRLLPGLDALRVPARFLFLGVLAVTLLPAQALGAVTTPWRRRAVVAFVSVVTAVELLPGPLPTVPERAPAPYRAIAADRDQGAVLELPLQRSTGTDVIGDLAAGREDSYLLGFVTTHQRPLVSGYASRYPASRLMRLTGDPLYRQVLALEDEPGYIDVPRFTAEDLRSAGIAFVVYHRDLPLPKAHAYVESLAMPVLADDGTVKVWKVPSGGTAAP